MKKTLKLIVISMVGATIISFSSCSYPPSGSDMQDEESQTQEPVVSNPSSEYNSYQEEKPQVNPIEHFARRYIFSDDGIGVEVLSDGRVLQISHIIATGEETKKYIGNISIISDNAFVVKGEVFFPGNTPIYVMRNGSEHGGTWTAKFGNDYYGVVFDISERRIYLGSRNAYENRDISEAEYIKYR